MFSRRIIALNMAAAALALSAPACASDDPGPDGAAGSGGSMCGTCSEPVAIDETAPEVSFKSDVFPLMRIACNGPTCHGAPLPGNGTFPGAGLYLGPHADSPPPDAATVDGVLANLKAPSKTAPEMAIVAPGDEARSFLIAKIHGCQNERGLSCTQQSTSAVRCESNPCGDIMPPVGEEVVITPEQRDLLRRWVAQGALDN